MAWEHPAGVVDEKADQRQLLARVANVQAGERDVELGQRQQIAAVDRQRRQARIACAERLRLRQAAPGNQHLVPSVGEPPRDPRAEPP